MKKQEQNTHICPGLKSVCLIKKVMICLPVCTGEELNRDSVCDRVSSVGCPCVGEGGGVAATRWRCFSSRDSKIPAANVASNM